MQKFLIFVVLDLRTFARFTVLWHSCTTIDINFLSKAIIVIKMLQAFRAINNCAVFLSAIVCSPYTHPHPHTPSNPQRTHEERERALKRKCVCLFVVTWCKSREETKEKCVVFCASVCVCVCCYFTTKMRDGKQRTWQLLAPAWWWWLWLPSVGALSSQFSRGGEYEDRKSPIIHFYFIINFITHKVKRRSRAASWWCTRLSTSMKNGNNNSKERKLERKRHTHTHTHTQAHTQREMLRGEDTKHTPFW